MESPAVLHVVRPYDDEESYLDREAWTIETRGMVLLQQPRLERDMPVVFDVALRDGRKLIRAEGRVAGYLEGTADRPPGLRVRFRRFGAKTKAFVERAIAERDRQLADRRPGYRTSSIPPSMSPFTPSPPPAAVSLPRMPPPPRVPSVPPSSGPPEGRPPQIIPSGPPAGRPPQTIPSAPARREELLARLRDRGRRGLAKVETLPSCAPPEAAAAHQETRGRAK